MMWSPAGWQSLVAFATFLSTPWSAVSTSCGVTASPGLRVNHAQVLGTHNSYKLNPGNDIPQFNYEHEPLGDQLDHGVRGLEIDFYMDTETNELKVMHVPFWDDKSSCATVSECLDEIAVWSNANPDHFPLHIRLEFVAALVEQDGDQAVCTSQDLGGAVDCVRDKCIGISIADAYTGCGVPCYAQIGELIGGPCQAVGECVLRGTFGNITFSTITEEYIDAAQSACLQAQQTGPTLVYPKQMNTSHMGTVFTGLEAAMDGAFPVEKRIVPGNVTLSDTEYVWPEVEDSRGKVWFYVTGPISEDDPESFHYFLRGKHDQITHEASPADVDVSMRQMVRVRVDLVDPFGFNPATFNTDRQSSAKSSGANILSTDFVVEAPWTTWDSITQEDAAANKQFFIEGGVPVACNPVTLPDGVSCTPEMLENLHCTTTSTTVSTTTKAQGQLLLDGDFAEVCGTEGTKASFLAECTADLDNVECTECLPGSLIVVVEASNPSDLEAAVMEVQNNGLDLPSFDAMIVVTTTATATSVTSVTATATSVTTTTTEQVEANAAAAMELVAAAFISLSALAWAC